MSFSENLQTLRKANNISQEQLAERLGVTRQTVSKWETGGYPEMDKLIALCNMFNCTMDDLVMGTVTADKQAKASYGDPGPIPDPGTIVYPAPDAEYAPLPDYGPTYVPRKSKGGKTAVIISVTIIIVIAMVLVFGLLTLRIVFSNGIFNGGFSLFGFGGTRYSYSNASSYTYASEFTVTDSISSIDVDWITGDVTIIPAEGDEIHIYEIAETSANGEGMMRYRVKDGTIYIKFREPGRYYNLKGKTLIIEVPEALSDVISLDISTVSALVACNDMTFSDTDVETVSGMVALSGFNTPALNVDTVSGDISVSGSIGKADIDTVSGHAGITAETAFSDISIDTVSGDVGVEAFSTFSDIDIETVSGVVELRLRSGAPKQIDIDTVSGNIDVDGTRAKHSYSVNSVDGIGKVDIDTTSGDVFVNIVNTK